MVAEDLSPGFAVCAPPRLLWRACVGSGLVGARGGFAVASDLYLFGGSATAHPVGSTEHLQSARGWRQGNAWCVYVCMWVGGVGAHGDVTSVSPDKMKEGAEGHVASLVLLSTQISNRKKKCQTQALS